jgi:TetR/AcrR family transcriptional regulator, fatty acid metabolism regulator protein
MPRPRRSDVITAFRTSALLEAARRVFGRSGFEAATIDEIAREAGVAKGTLYLYYRSKRSIYWAALQQGIAELDAQTWERVRRAATLHDAIRSFILTKVEYFDQRREFFRIYVQELSGQAARPAYGHTDFKPLYQRQVRGLQAAVAAAIGRGEIRQVDAAQAAGAIVDLTRGVVTRRLMRRRRAAAAAEVDAIVDLIWRGLASKGSLKR